LPEEKRRGITIDLGFAPLDLPDVGVAGVVDVPGHEAFVRTMLAGATGIDVALLIVAADEGVMPQTREHVAILELLGIRGGVVALTKCDLVDDDWLDLVRLDVGELLAGTALATAPMIPTSVVTGDGLSALRDALAAAASSDSPRREDDVFRMPIDRVFTVKGTGTVVTGTVWSGTVGRDAAVRVMPDDRAARVRGLQAHGAAIDRARPGTRLAVALAGIDQDAIARGAVLVADSGWHPTRVLRGDVTLLAGTVATLSPRATVRFHLGTTEVGARIVTPGGPLGTLGGGIVVDPHPIHRRARPWTAEHESIGARLALALREAGGAGLEISDLPVRLGCAPADIAAYLRDATAEVLKIGGRLFEPRCRDDLLTSLLREVDNHHAQNPLDTGVALQTVRARLAGRPELVDDAFRVAAERGETEVEGGTIRRKGWAPIV
jgi:selenocysteine-specific elongation factor